VQELYDEKVLHSILGIKSLLPTVVEHIQSDETISQSPSSKRQASKVVEDAWEEQRRSRDYAHDESSRHRQRIADDYEEGGRYDIGRHSSKKRRKTGRAHHHVVFVDDEDEEERHGYDDDEDEPEYDDHYYHESDVDRYSENPRNDKRRSYWLSKSIGPGSVDEEDTSY
jgi:non-canonical poly(A) RNA polymerase PAPD5/7